MFGLTSRTSPGAAPRSQDGADLLWCLLLVSLVSCGADSRPTEGGGFVRCEATRDVWLSAVEEERNFNMGAATKIKLKVWQEFGLVDFDVTQLQGKSVNSAYLYLKPAGGQKFGLNGGSDLRWLTVSTVSHDWVEGKSRGYGEDSEGHGATFLESSFSREGWGWSNSRVWDVAFGNGNTLRFDGQLEPIGDGWLRGELDVGLVQALVSGASYGLALMDGSTDVIANNYVMSRESGEGPYLEVMAGEVDPTPPEAPKVLGLSSAPGWASANKGAAEITVQVPRDAFALRLRIGDSEVQRWQIPFPPSGGGEMTFPILDQRPETMIAVEVAAVDTAGNISSWATGAGKTSAPLVAAELPGFPFHPEGGEPPNVGSARIWAVPEVTKLDPVTGSLIGEESQGDFSQGNPVWDGAKSLVRLAAARGEIVSFQLVFEGRVSGCRIRLPSLEGPGTIDKSAAKLWRNWYVGRQAEYAIPLKGQFDVPFPDNVVSDQKLQAITVDYFVSGESAAGEYSGMIAISCKGGSVSLPLMIRVYEVTIPDEVFFNVELNCYSGPGRAGSDRFIDSFRLAHYHRSTINRVPYSQKGSVHKDWAPRVDAKGRVADWSEFDRNLGGLLDGSWFKDNPRRGVPVPVLYLPLFEGWPKDFREHYDPGAEVPLTAKSREQKLRHDTLARPIDESLDEEFSQAFSNTVQSFVEHLRKKGWNRTLFQVYLNNKSKYGYSFWELDEPFKYLDWAALNFFGRLVRSAVEDPEVYEQRWYQELFRLGLAKMNRPRATILYRADVSRFAWQGSVSDGIMNSAYVGSAKPELHRLHRNSKLRMPAILYAYGSANRVEESNWRSVYWCLSSYLGNLDGVLPWQSLGGEEALLKPKRTALIIQTSDYGEAIASLRLHALRRGAQDSELLRLLQLRNGWSREQVALLVSSKVPVHVDGRPIPRSLQDRYPASMSSQEFYELKEGVLQLLEQTRRPD